MAEDELVAVGAVGAVAYEAAAAAGSSSSLELPNTLTSADYTIRAVADDGWCLYKAFLTPFGLASSENARKLACIVADKITAGSEEWQNTIGVQVMADATATLPPGLKRTATGEVQYSNGLPYMGVATQETANSGDLYILVGGIRRKIIQREGFIKSITTLRTADNIDSGPIAYPESQVFFQALNKINDNIRVIFYKQERGVLTLQPLFFDGNLNDKLFIFIRHDGNHFDYIEPTVGSSLPVLIPVPFDQDALDRLYSSSTCAGGSSSASGGAGGGGSSAADAARIAASGGAGGGSSAADAARLAASGGAGGGSSESDEVSGGSGADIVSRATAIINKRKEQVPSTKIGAVHYTKNRSGIKSKKTQNVVLAQPKKGVELSSIKVTKTAAEIIAEISTKQKRVVEATTRLENIFTDLSDTVINKQTFTTLKGEFITLESDIEHLTKYYTMLTATDAATIAAKANIVLAIQASFKLDKLIKLFGITVDILEVGATLGHIVDPTAAMPDEDLKKFIGRLQKLLVTDNKIDGISAEITSVTSNTIGDITASLGFVQAALEALRTNNITGKYTASIRFLIDRVMRAANAAANLLTFDTAPLWVNYEYIFGLPNAAAISEVAGLQTALKALQTRVFTAKKDAASVTFSELFELNASITPEKVTDANELKELVLRKVCTLLLAEAERINGTLATATAADVTAATTAIGAIRFEDAGIRPFLALNSAKVPLDPVPVAGTLLEQQEQVRDAFMRVKFNIEFRRRQLVLATITAKLIAITDANIEAAADSAALDAIDAQLEEIQREYTILMNTPPTPADLLSLFGTYNESAIVALTIPTAAYDAQVARLTGAIAAKRATLADPAIVEIEAAVAAYMASVNTATTQLQQAVVVDPGNPVYAVIQRAKILKDTLVDDQQNRVETAIFRAECSIALAHLKENRRDLEAIAAPTQFRTARANVTTANNILQDVSAQRIPDITDTNTETTDPYSAAYLVREYCLVTATSIKTINEVAMKKFGLDAIVADYEGFNSELERLYNGARVATRNAVIAEAKTRSLDISNSMERLQRDATRLLSDIEEALDANQTAITGLPAFAALQAVVAAAQDAVTAGGTADAIAAAAIALKNAQNAQGIANTKRTAFELIAAQVGVYGAEGEVASRRLTELTDAITPLRDNIDHINFLAGVFDFYAPTPAEMHGLSAMHLTVAAMLPTKGKKAVTAPEEINRLNATAPLPRPLTAVALAKKRLMGL